MKRDFSKLLLYGISGLFLLPVFYLVTMAFTPEKDKSALTESYIANVLLVTEKTEMAQRRILG